MHSNLTGYKRVWKQILQCISKQNSKSKYKAYKTTAKQAMHYDVTLSHFRTTIDAMEKQ